jgi:hypothetical protein
MRWAWIFDNHTEIALHVTECNECLGIIVKHLASKGGKSRSKAKANAARMNGKKGGRPRQKMKDESCQ